MLMLQHDLDILRLDGGTRMTADGYLGFVHSNREFNWIPRNWEDNPALT